MSDRDALEEPIQAGVAPSQLPPAAPSTAPSDSPALATCMQLLSKSSDAEKFAGLMLVPR